MTHSPHLTVRGFKSIASLEDFELRSLNVLIGANGAGKSNLLDVLRMLPAIVSRRLQLFVAEQGGPDALLHRGRKHTKEIDVEYASGHLALAVVGEGQTEESFIRECMAPVLAHRGIYVTPRLIRTSRKARGGALTKDRVLHHLPRILKGRDDLYVAKFFDLYGLAPDFPGVHKATVEAYPIRRAEVIEAGLREVVVEAAQCRPERFLPHIQPYEFESLLFSDVSQFGTARPEWTASVSRLKASRASAASPEHINDGVETHLSARLRHHLTPRYNKPLDGSTIASRIGLPRIRAECRHFASWLDRIENLPPLRPGAAPP